MYIKEPIAKKAPLEFENHGIQRVDPYYWLNDRDNKEVISYLNEENSYTKEKLKTVESLQNQLFEEITGRIKKDDSQVPFYYNGYWYITRFEQGHEHPLHERRKSNLNAMSELLIDVNKLATNHSYYHLNSIKISPDNNLLCFSEDTKGRRQYTLRFLDLRTMNFLKDEIHNTDGNVVWTRDSESLFYTIKNKSLREYKIFKHKLGESKDKEVYHEEDETFYVSISKSNSEDFIIISSSSTLTSEHRYISSDEPDAEFKVFQKRIRGLEYDIDHHDDLWFIHTNHEATNFQIMKCELHKTELQYWENYIKYEPNIYTENIHCFQKYMCIQERVDGLSKVKINFYNNSFHYIDFEGEAGYQVGISANPDYNSTCLRINFSSLKTPATVYDYDVYSKSLEVKKTLEIVGGYDASQYHTERLFATSSDGTKIPISLIYNKSLHSSELTQNLLLYGYGSYGISIEPSFSIARISLLDRGFIYAIAHIRGGEELGREWYNNGKLLKKQNTFSDFIVCAEHLINLKFTTPNQLYAMGGSAGGLLIGAVINQRPELWKAVIAAVPFVDVVTTMLDDTIPLTTGEYDEWGNPNDPTYFNYMLNYSPYDQVKAQTYPNILVTTGLHDSQVQYWEPAKWVAKLRDLKTDRNILLLHCNMETGHSGETGRFKAYREIAMNYAFIIGISENKI